MAKTAILQAGKLIESKPRDDKKKQPTRRQAIRLEDSFNNLPTWEILRRLYRRHCIGLWMSGALLTWAWLLYQKFNA